MKTVRVRIPVAVDQKGQCVWSTGGTKWDNETNFKDTQDVALGYLDGHYSIHWITAEVPLPEPAEVEGVVEKGGEG